MPLQMTVSKNKTIIMYCISSPIHIKLLFAYVYKLRSVPSICVRTNVQLMTSLVILSPNNFFSYILQLQCCGLTNYTDWKVTPWGRGHTGKLPHSCCRSTSDAICSDRKETAVLYRTVIIKYYIDTSKSFNFNLREYFSRTLLIYSIVNSTIMLPYI